MKYAGRRPKRPIHAPTRQPITAPPALKACVYAFARGWAAPAIWSAQRAIHWTAPHVTIRAIDAKAMASAVVLSSGGEKISASGFVGPLLTACFHFSDSGTN